MENFIINHVSVSWNSHSSDNLVNINICLTLDAKIKGSKICSVESMKK